MHQLRPVKLTGQHSLGFANADLARKMVQRMQEKLVDDKLDQLEIIRSLLTNSRWERFVSPLMGKSEQDLKTKVSQRLSEAIKTDDKVTIEALEGLLD